jgi:hypothetical protein
MEFYCGLNNPRWNHHAVRPGPFACVSPVMGRTTRTKIATRVNVPFGTQVLQDSGAFCDGLGDRLTFEQALDRQIAHAHRNSYAPQVTHRASYDLLIDEVWTNENRMRRRWSIANAETAVKETISAARFLADQNDGVGHTLSAQGVDAFQYLECVQEIVPLLRQDDILGLGGWCPLGRLPAIMMPVFRETICLVIPWAASHGVKRIHIWGVLYAPAIGELQWLCDQHNITVSTDSAGPVVKPTMGKWGYMGWTKRNYQRADTNVRGLHQALHVQLVRCWLQCLRQTKYYREPILKPSRVYQQLSLLEIE